MIQNGFNIGIHNEAGHGAVVSCGGPAAERMSSGVLRRCHPVGWGSWDEYPGVLLVPSLYPRLKAIMPAAYARRAVAGSKDHTEGLRAVSQKTNFHGQRARNTSNGRRVPRWFSDFRESAKFLRMRGVKDLKPKKDPKGGITFTDNKAH